MKWISKALVAVGGVGVAVALGASVVRARRAKQPPKAPTCHAQPLARRTFGAPVELSQPGSGTDDRSPTAALDAQGNLVAAFMSHSESFGNDHLGVVRVGLDGALRRSTLKGTRAQVSAPAMAADRAGALHLVYLSADGSAPGKHVDVDVASGLPGMDFTNPVAAQDPNDCPKDVPGCLASPAVASDGTPSGVYLAYVKAPGHAIRVLRRSADKSGPSAAVRPGEVPVLAVEGHDLLSALYLEHDVPDVDRFGDARTRLEFVRSHDGGKTFSVPVEVSREGERVPLAFAHPQLLIDGPRKLRYALYAAQRSDQSGWDVVLATSRDDGAHWRHIRVNDGAPCGAHLMPFAALDPKTGAVHVAWVENRTGQGGVAYARCQSGGARCSGNEAVSAPFASFTLGRGAPDSLGAGAQLLIDPARRTVDAVWAQPVREQGRALTRVFFARGHLAD